MRLIFIWHAFLQLNLNHQLRSTRVSKNFGEELISPISDRRVTLHLFEDRVDGVNDSFGEIKDFPTSLVQPGQPRCQIFRLHNLVIYNCLVGSVRNHSWSKWARVENGRSGRGWCQDMWNRLTGSGTKLGVSRLPKWSWSG